MTQSDKSDRALPPLYACHECRRIGPPGFAFFHHEATGHPYERIGDEQAAAVREIWAAEGRSLLDGAPKAE